jgi:hypothetical protein
MEHLADVTGFTFGDLSELQRRERDEGDSEFTPQEKAALALARKAGERLAEILRPQLAVLKVSLLATEQVLGFSYDDLLDRIDCDDPRYGKLTMADIVRAGDEGYRGMEAVHAAARRKSDALATTNGRQQTTARVAVRPAAHGKGTTRAARSRRVSSTGSSSRGSRGSPRSSDDPSEPPLTRLQLWRLAISEAVRVRIEQFERDGRECGGCGTWNAEEDFRPGRRVCTSCETEARIERRQRRAVAA